jgi:ribose 5-phosphate isomerase B
VHDRAKPWSHDCYADKKMQIVIVSDHAGYLYKMMVSDYLRQRSHKVDDLGTQSLKPVDYPDFVFPAARAVASGQYDRGIVIGASGNGEAMAANKIRGIRCALCWDEESAKLSRLHNDANMLSLGERLTSEDMALRIVQVWLDTAFEGGRHIARIAKLDATGGV